MRGQARRIASRSLAVGPCSLGELALSPSTAVPGLTSSQIRACGGTCSFGLPVDSRRRRAWSYWRRRDAQHDSTHHRGWRFSHRAGSCAGECIHQASSRCRSAWYHVPDDQHSRRGRSSRTLLQIPTAGNAGSRVTVCASLLWPEHDGLPGLSERVYHAPRPDRNSARPEKRFRDRLRTWGW